MTIIDVSRKFCNYRNRIIGFRYVVSMKSSISALITKKNWFFVS